MSRTTISTWFVADQPDEQTDFPQVGGRSDSTGFQAVYWRCIACFFASSAKANPTAKHAFFTNTVVPTIDGVCIQSVFDALEVEVINLPIMSRLPKNSVSSWGNQFYILDVIRYAASHFADGRLIVLDSDCVLTRDTSELERAVEENQVLSYTLYEDQPRDYRVNGVTRPEMAQIANSVFGLNVDFVPYSGGEIFAATISACKLMIPYVERLWAYTIVPGQRLFPREEALFLSIIYAAMFIRDRTANSFIKRMWTTLSYSNVSAADVSLPIWHLPAEKRSGFQRLFKEIFENRNKFDSLEDAADLLTLYQRTMGIPRRSVVKLGRDVSAKLTERFANR
ncbi:MAG: hypothetical protein ACRYGG_23805 [Janthinobacterium lividum]